jgi:hypothetical protein
MKRKFLFFLPFIILLPSFTLWIIRISVREFIPSFGNWKGTLTYLDYTSGKPYTLPVNLYMDQNAGSLTDLIFNYTYPTEPKANSKDIVKISEDGRSLNNERVVELVHGRDINYISTETHGQDGNDHKPATIRHVYALGKEILDIKKEVKFDGEENWILRNEYSLKR